MTYYHLCHILTQTNHGILEVVTTQRFDYQETKISVGHFRGWLSQERSRINGRERMSSESEMAVYIQVEIVSKRLDIHFKSKREINTRNKNLKVISI